MVVGRNNGLVGLTGVYSDKEMGELLFGLQGSGRMAVFHCTEWLSALLTSIQLLQNKQAT